MAMVENLNKFADKYRVVSSRKTNWDYSTTGFYFVTLCTLNHNNFFGKIINSKMELNQKGKITNDCLIQIPIHFKNVLIHESVIMPNHIHLLLELIQTNVNLVETRDRASLHIEYQSYHFHRIAIRSNQTIPKIINQFKSSVKRQRNQQNLFFAWQPRYHDIIIKDQKQYFTIKNYIKNNVINWEKDRYFVNS